MPLIYHVSLYIPCIYQSVCDIPVIYQAYSLYILHCLSFVYTSYIQYICIVYHQYSEYAWDIIWIFLLQCIYMVHAQYIMRVYTPPGGWCCRGGQDPIPPDPAITSPGRVIISSNCQKDWLLEQRINCHSRNIPGIYQVYSRNIPKAEPWTSGWIQLQPWPPGNLQCPGLMSGAFPYIYPYLPHIFQGYTL